MIGPSNYFGHAWVFKFVNVFKLLFSHYVNQILQKWWCDIMTKSKIFKNLKVFMCDQNNLKPICNKPQT